MTLGNVHITPQLVQAVRDAADIVAVASEHTRLRKAGRRYQGLCPIHKEKTPSFSVDPVQGLFYCFGCGAGGDAIKLHMLTSGDDFPAAIEALALRFGIPLPSRAEKRAGWSGGEREERDLEGALQAAARFFVDQLARSAVPRQYLEKRRIPPELIERFGLGYAPDGWRTLVQALHPRIPMADLEAAGLVGRPERGGEPYDRFRHRLMFPIHNASGRLVGFGGRTLGDDKAKYINTSETDRFHKGLLLYGLHLAKKEIRETGRAVLCEGYFDVIGTVACGLEGAVAGMGTALTPEQAKLLSRYAEDVVVAYDGDNAGENAFRRALPLLLGEGLGVRRARFPEGHDPDSLRLETGEAAVAEAVDAAQDAVAAEIERLIPPGTASDPRAQAKGATAVAELLRPIPDAILRYGYARGAANHLNVPVEMLVRRTGGEQSAVRLAEKEPLAGRLEERVIERLLEAEEAIPPPAELPPAEVFLDTGCRNIYQTFCALYAKDPGRRPDARTVRDALGHEGGIVDRFARILLEGSFAPGRIGLLESLDKLEDRWLRQRQRELANAIREAVRQKDELRATQLYEEKRSLGLSLHRRSRPGALGNDG
ncbi:MAG TPA: DNA primase [Thermoanaerobaculia bacterium]|nr:DNA primase [Thermoanaerobaculia bacterium]